VLAVYDCLVVLAGIAKTIDIQRLDEPNYRCNILIQANQWSTIITTNKMTRLVSPPKYYGTMSVDRAISFKLLVHLTHLLLLIGCSN